MPIRLRVRELRLKLGLTQGQLAAVAGVTRATVNRLENAVPASIDFDVLERLADALGVRAGKLITHEPREESPARPRVPRAPWR